MSALATGALAQAMPASCVSAAKVRDDYIKRVGRGPNPLETLAYGTDAASMQGQREINAEAQLATVARMCIGDLVADKRYDEAAAQALRFGLAKDAEALYRQVEAQKAREAH